MESSLKTNPPGEVAQKPLNMFDVMFGSDNTNPKNTDKAARTNANRTSSNDANSNEVEAPVYGRNSSSDTAAEEQSVEYDSQENEQLASEDNTEPDAEEDAEEVKKEPSPRHTVKVDGEEFEVSLDELRNGYQRQTDYTRKSQSLAEQRKAYEANIQAVQTEREKYAKVLESIGQQQSAEVQRFANIDWNSLKESDPMQYMEKKLEYQEAREKQAQIATERQRTMQRSRNEFQSIVAQKVQEEAKALEKVLPEFVSPNSSLKSDLRNYAMGLGFSDQDIDSITDHRVVLVLHKAMQQDKAAHAPAKMVKNVPKVVKSGAPESKDGKSRRDAQQRRERLAKTGSTRDAASVFMDILDNPRPKR